ncbi:MAG: class I SAM-dependent methyltransferase [Sphingobacteriia bacterium]|nr:class I SAM-dependent methyltransferase [Sphingobacteriia bacterium]
MIIHHNTCPSCSNKELKNFLCTKDFSFSQEDYQIVQCNTCKLLFTQDIPDQESIGKYYSSQNYISHSNDDNSWFHKIYQIIRKTTLKQKRRWVSIQKPIKGKILDLGAGTGYFVAEMKNAGWEVIGLEPSTDARNQAELIHKIKLFPTEDFNSLPADNFEVITLWHVLEHVHDLNGYAKRFFELLKPGGILMIAVPNADSFDAKKYGKYWAAYDVPRHLYHFTPETVKKGITKHGFKFVKQYPQWFDAFYVAMLSESYLGRNKIGGILQGLISNIHAITNKGQTSSLLYVFQKPNAENA